MMATIMKTLASFLAFSTSLLCPCFAQKGKVAPPIEGAEHIVYKEASGSKLILNVFHPQDRKTKKEKRPAIVFFFGGGWSGGSPAQFAPHCEYLASRGMVAITADYRVKSRQGTPPFECVKTENRPVGGFAKMPEGLGSTRKGWRRAADPPPAFAGRSQAFRHFGESTERPIFRL